MYIYIYVRGAIIARFNEIKWLLDLGICRGSRIRDFQLTFFLEGLWKQAGYGYQWAGWRKIQVIELIFSFREKQDFGKCYYVKIEY